MRHIGFKTAGHAIITWRLLSNMRRMFVSLAARASPPKAASPRRRYQQHRGHAGLSWIRGQVVLAQPHVHPPKEHPSRRYTSNTGGAGSVQE
jgi:hypothetical protein